MDLFRQTLPWLALWLISLPVTALEEGEPAPDFTLPALAAASGDSDEITLSDLRGKVVYVDFWASWCLPCIRSLPEISTLYEQYRDQGFEVIAITIDNPLEDATEFLEDLDTPLDYRVAADADADVMDLYGVRGMPTSFLVDRHGMIRMIHEGYRDGDLQQIENELTPLL
ncbi:MAG: TlpA disulfide reductase family protein [Pseudohongiellaceae bacterium]